MSGTELEIRTERDWAWSLGRGSEGPVLRVRYRETGTRYWVKFLLIPEVDESYHELECQAAEAVAAHRGRGRTWADNGTPA